MGLPQEVQYSLKTTGRSASTGEMSGFCAFFAISSLLFACHLELDPCLAEAGFQIFLSSSSYPDIPALEKRENCGEKHNRVLRLWLVRHTWSLPLIPLEELNSWLP